MRSTVLTLASILTVICIAFSCASGNKVPPECLSGEIPEWIEGVWRQESENELFIEQWIKINDTLLTGVSTMMKNGDTLFTEQLMIVKETDRWHYYAAVSNQNEGEKIDFPLVYCENHKLLFENPGHDYPQRIEYQLLSTDTLMVKIGSSPPSEKKQSSFTFIRAVK